MSGEIVVDFRDGHQLSSEELQDCRSANIAKSPNQRSHKPIVEPKDEWHLHSEIESHGVLKSDDREKITLIALYRKGKRRTA